MAILIGISLFLSNATTFFTMFSESIGLLELTSMKALIKLIAFSLDSCELLISSNRPSFIKSFSNASVVPFSL